MSLIEIILKPLACKALRAVSLPEPGPFTSTDKTFIPNSSALDAAELMIKKAAWKLDNDMACGTEANMAKWLAAEAGFYAADCAVQTHGGFGYAREYHVERYWREARLMKLAPISQEMILNFVAEHELGLPRSY